MNYNSFALNHRPAGAGAANAWVSLLRSLGVKPSKASGMGPATSLTSFVKTIPCSCARSSARPRPGAKRSAGGTWRMSGKRLLLVSRIAGWPSAGIGVTRGSTLLFFCTISHVALGIVTEQTIDVRPRVASRTLVRLASRRSPIGRASVVTASLCATPGNNCSRTSEFLAAKYCLWVVVTKPLFVWLNRRAPSALATGSSLLVGRGASDEEGAGLAAASAA